MLSSHLVVVIFREFALFHFTRECESNLNAISQWENASRLNIKIMFYSSKLYNWKAQILRHIKTSKCPYSNFSISLVDVKYLRSYRGQSQRQREPTENTAPGLLAVSAWFSTYTSQAPIGTTKTTTPWLPLLQMPPGRGAWHVWRAFWTGD